MLNTSLQSPTCATAVLDDRPTVLIVENDDLIRDGIARWLTMEGWPCVAARDVRSAIALQEAQAPGIAICDLHLDGLECGRQLAADLTARDPRLAVIYATGDIEFAPAPGTNASVLHKPFGRAQVAAALDAALSRRTAQQG